jgi:hypothetical protein
MRFSSASIFFLVVLTGLAACSLDIESVPDRHEHIILRGQGIDATPDTTLNGSVEGLESWSYELKDSSTNVALYIFETDGDPTIIDDELFLQFFFEFDPTVESFILQDSMLWNAKALLDLDCYCLPVVYRIDDGKIIGSKLDADSWHFDIDVRYHPNPADPSTTVPLQLSEDFHVRN